MLKWVLGFTALCLAGCATGPAGGYRPVSRQERAAFEQADLALTPAAVRAEMGRYRNQPVAWAGLIEEIQFKETERTIQVAFRLDHRPFDWLDHGGRQPYRISAQGDGPFVAGWEVPKPTSIGYLKTLAAPGDLLLVYGTPLRIASDGVLQLAATAVRPIAAEKVAVETPSP